MDVDMEASCELAWKRFRARLADRLAGLEDDEILLVEVRTEVAHDELAGTAPYLQFLNWGEGRLRAEAAGNAYLDERFELGDADADALVEIGWEPPRLDDDGDPAPGFENFFVFSTLAYADQVAALSVAALREVYHVPHPIFLDAEGLEVDEGWTEPGPPAGEPVVEQPCVLVHDEEHLQRLVDAALEVMFEEPADHDEDGDLPITCGLSRAFVRVLPDRPAVEVFAYAVVEVADRAAALVEVDRLNRYAPDVQWYVEDDMVIARCLVLGQPFVASHLREAVARFCEELDETAQAVARRTGGRAFLQRRLPPRPGRPQPSAPGPSPHAVHGDTHPALVELLEMLHVDDVQVLTVASLFAHDRREVVRQIVRVRTGVQDLDGLDEERVLRHLRRTLRLLADRQARAERNLERPERRPATRQLSLLSDEELGQDSLESGWGA